MTDLNSLAERCAKATGPDRELDRGIMKAVGWLEVVAFAHSWQDPQGQMQKDCPRPTASIDAAMTLVPDHISVELFMASLGTTRATLAGNGDEIPDTDMWGAIAATPALALCAAALKARARAGGE